MQLSLPFVHSFITSLVFTDVVETALLWVFLKFVFKRSLLSTSAILFAGLFASFATIPYVWFVFPNIAPGVAYGTTLVISEVFAFVVEAIFYRNYLKITVLQAVAVSLVCNAASFYLYQVLHAYGVWFYW